MTNNAALDTRLESRLRRACLLGDEQLVRAQELTRTSAVSLSDAIVQLGIISESEMGNILESLQETRSIKLEDVVIDLESVKHIPAQVGRMHRCIPIRRSGNTLVVAMSDPSDGDALTALRAVTDFEIMSVQAESEPIEHALYIHYGAEEDNSNVAGLQGKKRASHNSWAIPSPWACDFESFVEHAGVKRARDIAKIVSSGNWEGLSEPILFVGPEGAGKTHLFTAVRNYTATRDPLLKCLLTDGATLKSDFADFALAGRLAALRFELRDRALLLLDDFYGSWGNAWLEQEIAEAIQVVLKNGGVVMVGLSVEQFFAGPFSASLRELLAKSTEVQLTPPTAEAMHCITAVRCKNPRVSDFVSQLAAETPHLSWNALRELSMAEGLSQSRSARP